MNPLRLEKKDWLFITVCLLVLVGGILVGLKYFKKAFPEASIDFRYNRSQTETMARDYLKVLNLAPPAGFRHAGSFGYDDLAKTYLEKELGVDSAGHYLGHPVRLWYWQHRWFRPATKEEFSVYVTPGGDVVHLDHSLEEQAAGADLPEAQARTIGEQFLFGPMKQDSSKLTFIESRRVGRPHRSDWIFTYRIAGIEPVKGSDYRYQITVLGDRIGGYREFLHVPEAWEASFQKLRSYNNLASTIDSVAFILTALAIAAVFFLRTRRRDIRWKTAVGFGIVAAVLQILNQLNELPLSMYGYDTTDPWSGFLLRTILNMAVGALGAGIGIFMLTASAETLYREQYPTKLALPRMFTWQALRTKRAFKNILLGVTMTSFFFAYQIAFYLIAGHYGAWSPSDVPYDNLLNTAMPWLAVLAMGFFPAVSEEFMSRMFSIPFLQKAFKNRYLWLAVLLPAVIWGFGHSAYPNEPWFIRGTEVGLAGILVGVIMLRYGILATLVWHYTVDALYTAMLLFRSDNPYFVFTAAVATGLMALPLILATLAYLRKRSFLPEAGVLNADLGTAQAEAPVVVIEATPLVTYTPLPAPRRMIAGGLFIAGVLAALIPVSKVGDFVEYPLPRESAEKMFADTLRASGWANPDTMKIAAFAASGGGLQPSHPYVYLLKHAGSVKAFNELADKRLGSAGWNVQAWVPENRLRFYGTVNPRTSRVQSLEVWMPEEMPGDSLPQARAQGMADSVLTKQGEDLSKLDLKEQNTQARPKRLDHSFVYEARDGDPRNIGEAKYRRGAEVNGRYLTVSSRPWYHIPESWQRAREATTALVATRKGLSLLIMAGLVAWAAYLVVRSTRRSLIPWKKVLLWAIVPAAITLLAELNNLYLAQASYIGQVETPYKVFMIGQMTGWLESTLFVYIYFALGMGLLIGLFPKATAQLKNTARKPAFLDAVLAGLAGMGALLLVRSAGAWLSAWRPDWITFGGWDTPDWIAAPMPFLELVQGSLLRMLLMGLLLGFFAYLWSEPMRKPWQRVLLILAGLLMFIPSSAVAPGEWLLAILGGAVRVLLVWVVLKFIAASQPLLFIVMLAFSAVFGLTATGLGTGNLHTMIHSWIFVAAAVLLFVYLMLKKQKGGLA